MIDDDTTPDDQLQTVAGHISDAFHRHDLAMLAQLTPEQRAVQGRLRRDLYMHADRIWEQPKHAVGEHPVDIGGYGSVAAMRDLLETLCGHVEDAQHTAGDTPEDYRVTVTVEQND